MSFHRYARESDEACMEEVTNFRPPDSEQLTRFTLPTHSCPHVDTAACQRELWEGRYPFDYLIPAPPTVLPKPLALAYRNYHLWYHKIDYHDGERKMAGSDLVSKLLHFYFPADDFEFDRIPNEGDMLPNVIIDTITVLGTVYWVVTVRQYKENDILVQSNANLPSSDGSGTPNHSGLNRPCSPAGPVVLLVAVATEKGFGARPERDVPSILDFSAEAMASSGTLQIGQYSFHRGHVVILGSKEDPSRLPPPPPESGKNKKKRAKKQGGPPPSAARPVWEFYTFDAESNGNRSIVPWFGATTTYPRGFSTNSFSLESNDLRNVDEMFKRLVRCSYRDEAN